MQVAIHFNDTMTGELEETTEIVSEFTGEAIRQAMEGLAARQTGEVEGYALEAWVLDRSQQHAVFILRDLGKDAYGGFLLYGTAFIYSR